MTRRLVPGLQLVDPASGRVLAHRVERPRTFFGRGLGLMFRRRLPAGEAMWIDPCDGIHMFWMRFAIDALFLDREERVVRVVRGLRPWRVVPYVRRARSVVELPAGTLDDVELAKGHRVELRRS